METETALEFFQKGVDLQQRGLFDHAIEEYERALKLEPENIDIMVNLGAACLQKGLSDRSIKLLAKVLEKDPNNSLALYNIGKAFVYREEYETALNAFNKAAALLPEDKDIKKAIAGCLRCLGQNGRAADIMLELIDMISSDVKALLELGENLRQLERFDEALDIFRRASLVACDSIAPLTGIYNCQMSLGNREKAMTALKRAIMIEPANQELLVKLADMHLNEGRIQEAVDTVCKGLETIASLDCCRKNIMKWRAGFRFLKRKRRLRGSLIARVKWKSLFMIFLMVCMMEK